ncbi:unnamed protein product [Effrenium voratum]|uniref:Uncharacterized protein n=1 Tax=Effrenium voratum TaxID=2562239 RepID=A0AA36HUH2_9DINO|nr:unnamed protein product [Effrenium voratum]
MEVSLQRPALVLGTADEDLEPCDAGVPAQSTVQALVLGTADEDLQPSQLTQSQGVGLVESDERLRFAFRPSRETADRRSDPAQLILSKLQECASDVGSCTRRRSQCLSAPRSTLVEVGDDSAFDINLLAPVPIITAVQTMCKAQGWCAEAALQGLFTVTGWLEHVDTRIQISEGEEHARTPTLAAFFGSRASNRKSSMHKWLLQELLDIDTLPHGVKGSAAIATDATMKGHRNNLYNYRRSGLSSTELSETYKTSWTDPSIPQAKLAAKSLINKFVHSERDASLTGATVDDNPHYSFYHWIIGHVQPLSEVLSLRKGAEVGFPKRFHIVVKGMKPATIPEQECLESKQFLADFMAERATQGDEPNKGATVTCDEFAAGWLRLIQQCVDDFAESVSLPETWSQKLDYAHQAACPPENEGHQLLRSLRLRAGLGFEEKAIGDIQYGIHSWSRQLEFYSGLVVAADKAGAEATSTGPAQGQDASHLCMKWVLQSTPSTTEVQSTKDVRKKLKGRLQALCDRGAKGDRKKKVNGPANTLLQAVRDLASHSLLDIVPGQGGGHATLTFRKRKWSDITDCQDSRDMCKSLRVGSELFP